MPAAASKQTPDAPNLNNGTDGEPSIAVLPFESAERRPGTGGFADGLVDDVIGSLASASGLVVIARSSTYTYKGRGADARTVGQELGVRYVVEGSLRVMAKRMRLHVTLIDCRTHGSLWSERFDAPVEDLFVVQDEITAQIMNSMRVTIGQSEARTIRRLTRKAFVPGSFERRRSNSFTDGTASTCSRPSN